MNRMTCWIAALPLLLALGCGEGETAPGAAQAGAGETGSAGRARPSSRKGLLMRAVVDGRETSLYEKVVVTSNKATIAPTPGEAGDYIEPWSIFFRLWTDDGRAVAVADGENYVRIGTAKGRPLGWIRERDVTSWSTRFVLEPLRPIPGRSFRVDLGDNNYATYKTAAEGKRRFALILEPPEEERGDETRYRVMVYNGMVQAQGQEGTLRRERNKIQDLKLEVVFVVEASHLMSAEYEDGVSALGTVKKIAQQWADVIKEDPELKGAIRLGLVEYQDATPAYDFVSRVSCPLTSDIDRFLGTLQAIDPPSEEEGREDDFWSQDALAGMQKAVDEAGWSENSSKQIVLFGASQPQIYDRHDGPNPFGRSGGNFVIEMFDRGNDKWFKHGYNTTGLSVRQIIARANPRSGGDVERARNAKTFHSVLVGYDMTRFIPEYETKVRPIVEHIISLNTQETLAELDRLSQKIGENQAVEIIATAYIIELIDRMRGQAQTTYAEISHNQEIDGMHLNVEPTAEGIRQAVDQINRTMVDAFKTLGGVRTGRVGAEELEADSNAITRTYFAIVGAAAAKFQEKPALEGFAKVRDEYGREVAHRRVIVSEDELRRLRSTLDAIRTKFQARVRKADRQDVSAILDELKTIAAQTATGQTQFAADVELKDVITDLPLRTSALETTPRSLAVMPSDAFRDWLGRLDVAISRADDLLAGKDWLVLSSLAENEKFTFLQLNELP